MHSVDEAVPASSMSESRRQSVLAQLESVLASPLFRQSKRYPAFLRYVVESTLEGSDEQLKERTIGMVVFGRQPQYDTNLDPTVRLTAAEVRKRLAQYYRQPEHALQIHIDLHPGSYVPTFFWPAGSAPADELPAPATLAVSAASGSSVLSPAEPTAVAKLPEQVQLPEPARSIPLLWKAGWVVAVAAVLLAIALLVSRTMSAPSSVGKVWSPLLADPNLISLVLPDVSKSALIPHAQEDEKTSVLFHIRDSQLVDFNDSVALAHLSGMLGKWNKPYRVLLSSNTSFGELQSGPSILIGAVDNPWTMRFLEPLPYSVAQRGNTMTFEIVGKKDRAQHDWSIDLAQPFEKLQQDFGIVARQTDTMTGRPVLIVAGLGQNGTAAGIRLLADPALESEITAAAPKGWSGRNLEIVFRTQIINDNFGPPIIVAREYW